VNDAVDLRRQPPQSVSFLLGIIIVAYTPSKPAMACPSARWATLSVTTDNQFQSWHRDDEILATPPFTVNKYTSRAIRQAVADGVDLRVG
jgi:hypothetical protein